MIRAAGVLFVVPDGRVLLLQRTDGAGWSTPGGHVEDGESAEEAAARECDEELGRRPDVAGLRLHSRRQYDGVDYTTFLARVPVPFVPKLNDEHDDYRWVHPKELEDEETRSDAQFEEVEHPWDEGGRFASGGGKPLTKYELSDVVSTVQVAPKMVKTLKDLGGNFHTEYAHASTSTPEKFRARQAEQFDRYHSSGAEHERAARREKYDAHTEAILEGVRELDALFASGEHRTKAPITLQRGTVDAEIPEGLSEGGVMQSSTFLSTTNKDSISKKYSGGISGPAQKPLRLRIEVPSGYPAINIKAAGAESFGEGEVLLPRGAKFRILKLDRDKGVATLQAIPFEEARKDSQFEESDHPRGEGGKFASAGGGGMRALDRSAMPEHVAKLKVPPAWRNVHYNPDPEAPLQVIGTDAKDRVVRIYSQKFAESQSANKFRRVSELADKFREVRDQNEKARQDPRTRDSADCAALIMEMGVRPGSDDDTGAKVKAYGATTLEGRHVVDEDGDMRLRFVGKKGVAIDLPVPEELRDMLRNRRDAAGADGKLFPGTDDKRLLDHVHTLDGGGFKTKDFRTLLATKTAQAAVAADPDPPRDAAEYRRRVMAVATLVSGRLGNTPVVALQSYISPTVFSSWQTQS